MFRTCRRTLTILTAVLTFSIFAPTAAHATTYDERVSVYFINQYDRKPRGLRPLAINESASNLARSHSAAMARSGRLYHSSLSYLGSKISGWSTLGENVGVGTSLRTLNQAFMNSPTHRSNILCRCFRQIGVGVVRDRRGYYWVTHIFIG